MKKLVFTDTDGNAFKVLTFDRMVELGNKLKSIGYNIAIEVFAPTTLNWDLFIANADKDDMTALYILRTINADEYVEFELILEESYDSLQVRKY